MSLALGAVVTTSLAAQTPVGGSTDPTFNNQPYQPPENCLPCHQRQYDELRSAVKAGYRNASPLQNSLEISANFLNGGPLRPVYADSTIVLPDGTPLNTNMFSTPSFTELRQVQAGFCLSCHNPHIEKMGDDPSQRVFPALPGVGEAFQPELLRPQRDYMMTDPSGHQILPDRIGGMPQAGAVRSLAGAGITCDVCHNLGGADLNRSFQQDGFGNISLLLNHSMEKVGPFTFPVMPKGGFHVASNDPAKMTLLRSAAFCNSCHDVRVPLGDVGPGDLQHYEHDINPGGENVTYFRLENLSSEWQTGPYNSTTANPFGQVVRCQDCHMSQFPYAGDSTYQAGDMTVTSPTPAIFFENYAAVPGVSTDDNYPLYKRSVVNHHFTGVDVPLLYPNELSTFLDAGYPDPNVIGTDEYGIPLALETRREDLLKAAVRINLDKTDKTFQIGQPFTVRGFDRTSFSGGVLAGAYYLHPAPGDRRQWLRFVPIRICRRQATSGNGRAVARWQFERRRSGTYARSRQSRRACRSIPHRAGGQRTHQSGVRTRSGRWSRCSSIRGHNGRAGAVPQRVGSGLSAWPEPGPDGCRRQSDCCHKTALRGDVQRRLREHRG
jgi:hypothetical protein